MSKIKLNSAIIIKLKACKLRGNPFQMDLITFFGHFWVFCYNPPLRKMLWNSSKWTYSSMLCGKFLVYWLMIFYRKDFEVCFEKCLAYFDGFIWKTKVYILIETKTLRKTWKNFLVYFLWIFKCTLTNFNHNTLKCIPFRNPPQIKEKKKLVTIQTKNSIIIQIEIFINFFHLFRTNWDNFSVEFFCFYFLNKLKYICAY